MSTPRSQRSRGPAAPREFSRTRARRRETSMSSTVSAIIDKRSAAVGKPSITYRFAGDRAILVEYGEMEFDLTLNFFVLAVDDALRARPVHGLVETAPGFRSIPVSYDPLRLALVRRL